MTLSTAEIHSLRFHLGYGSLSNDALPYTPDGFWHTFEQVVSPYLSTGTEDSSTTAVTAGAVTTITISSASGLSVYDEMVIDVGVNAEIVRLQAVSTGGATETITAYFAKAHSASGYPVSTACGKARLRMLLYNADEAWQAMTGSAVGATAGIKSVDKEDVVFFEGSQVLSGRLEHYKTTVTAISALVRVAPVWHWPGQGGGGRTVRTEAY